MDELHEIFYEALDKENDNLGEKLKDVSKGIEESQAYLKNLQSDSYSPSIRSEIQERKAIIDATAFQMKEDLDDLTKAAQEDRLQIDEDRDKMNDARNPYLDKEKRVSIFKLDFENYRAQASSFIMRMSAGISSVVPNVRKAKNLIKNHIAISAATMGVVGGIALGAGATVLLSNAVETYM